MTKKVDDIKNDNSLAPFKTIGTACKINPGRPINHIIIWEELSWLVFEMRQKGIQVTTSLLQQEASPLLPSFMSKTVETRMKVISHFTKQLGFTHHAATQTAQKHSQETEEESKHFIEMMNHKIMGNDPCDIINMY